MKALADLAVCFEAVAGAQHVVTGAALERYRIGHMEPALALRPADETEVSRCLDLAWGEGLAVVPWGSGLHQSLGHPPARYDVALDLGRLDRVVDHQPGDMTVTVQAGVSLAALQCQLGRHGQFFPLDPPRGDRATVGGILSANLAGPLRCRYGTARDLVLGLRVVHADGTITKGGGRVVKNATAYDIPKLYLGSYGTLGVIVEATVRAYPRAPVEAGELFAFPDVSSAQAVCDRVLHSPLVPTRLEMTDGAALASIDGTGSAGLAMTFGGVPEAVVCQREAATKLAASCGGKALGLPDLAGSLRRLQDFPWGTDGGALLRLLWRGGVLPVDCGKAMASVHHVAGGACVAGSIATVSAGVLRGCIVSDDSDQLARSVRAARDALELLGGYLVILDAPPSVRAAVDVWGAAPPSLPLMRQLRQAFDERSIINPGRFLDGL